MLSRAGWCMRTSCRRYAQRCACTECRRRVDDGFGLDGRSAVLDDLSLPLREQVTIHRCKAALESLSIKLPAPGEPDSGLAGAVALRLTHAIYLSGDYLIRQGRMGQGLFVIVAGHVDIIVIREGTAAKYRFSSRKPSDLERRNSVAKEKSEIIGQLGAGSIVGEGSLLEKRGTHPMASVLCPSYCESFNLSTSAFNELAGPSLYPELRLTLEGVQQRRFMEYTAVKRIQRRFRRRRAERDIGEYLATFNGYGYQRWNRFAPITPFNWRSAPSSDAASSPKWYARVLLPTSRLSVCLDAASLPLLVYTAIILPWRVAFGPIGMRPYDFSTSPYAVFELLIDVFFLLEMARSLRTAHYDESGYTLIVAAKEVEKRYLLTWFLPDLVATIPWDYITLTSSTSQRLVSLLRLLRLLRLPRITSRLTTAFSASFFSGEIDQGSDSFVRVCSLLRSRALWLFAYLCSLLLAAHVSGCIQFLIADGRHSSTWSVHAGLADAPTGEQYLGALSHALLQMLCVSSGLVTPTHPEEMVLLCVSMLIGLRLVAAFISHTLAMMIQTLLRSLGSASDASLLRDARLEQWLTRTSIPTELKTKLRIYCEYAHRRGHLMDERRILSTLSPPLREQLMSARCHGVLAALGIRTEDEMRRKGEIDLQGLAGLLAVNLQEKIFMPGEYLIHEGVLRKGCFASPLVPSPSSAMSRRATVGSF